MTYARKNGLPSGHNCHGERPTECECVRDRLPPRHKKICRSSSSFVYHRLILSTLCVGAMLWSMAQLRKICRTTRFQIVLARTMTNHSLYFSCGAHPTSRQFSRSPFATARRQHDASRSRTTCRSNARAH